LRNSVYSVSPAWFEVCSSRTAKKLPSRARGRIAPVRKQLVQYGLTRNTVPSGTLSLACNSRDPPPTVELQIPVVDICGAARTQGVP